MRRVQVAVLPAMMALTLPLIGSLPGLGGGGAVPNGPGSVGCCFM